MMTFRPFFSRALSWLEARPWSPAGLLLGAFAGFGLCLGASFMQSVSGEAFPLLMQLLGVAVFGAVLLLLAAAAFTAWRGWRRGVYRWLQLGVLVLSLPVLGWMLFVLAAVLLYALLWLVMGLLALLVA